MSFYSAIFYMQNGDPKEKIKGFCFGLVRPFVRTVQIDIYPYTDSSRMSMTGPHQAPRSSLKIGVIGKTLNMRTRTTMVARSLDFIMKPKQKNLRYKRNI